MKKITLIFLLVFAIWSLQAQEYLISFAGTGASTTIDTVTVENLTQGKIISLSGTDVLHLVASTGLNPLPEIENALSIYPNPTTGNSTISFIATVSGNTSLELIDITGKRIGTTQNSLTIGAHSYQVSGLRGGIYIIKINSQAYTYTGKLISHGEPSSGVKISYIGNSSIPVTARMLKSANSEKVMQYTAGDRLKITGISGNFSTVITDIPTESKTLTFEFIACTDDDGNNYPVVQIGTQLWMARNLKTTKYNDGTNIPNVTDNTEWHDLTTPSYCWYNNDIANKNKYGALYNWYAKNTGKLCPKGWHVPLDAEWTILTNFLGGATIAGDKLLETGAQWSWWTGATNETGFTALPGGYRPSIFYYIGDNGYWWGSTAGYTFAAWYSEPMHFGYTYVYRVDTRLSDGFSVRCVRDGIFIPVLRTTTASSTSNTSAICEGNISFDGYTTITARGVCWNTIGNPTIDDSKTTDGIGTGSFTSNLSNLTAGTLYYVRAYATNCVDTAYGNQLSFKTSSGGIGGTVTDIDGNVYQVVTIGTQDWMVGNLKTTKYNDGTNIPNVTGDDEWSHLITPGFCWYNNDVTNKDIYGSLYNWYTVNTGKLCPIGWHVPTDAEWTTLVKYVTANLGTSSSVAKALASKTDWASSTIAGSVGNDLTKNNTTGFTALSGGYCLFSDGIFYHMGDEGNWWSSTEESTSFAWIRYLNNTDISLPNSYVDKKFGLSIRCVRD